jgi:hypothetical protein
LHFQQKILKPTAKLSWMMERPTSISSQQEVLTFGRLLSTIQDLNSLQACRFCIRRPLHKPFLIIVTINLKDSHQSTRYIKKSLRNATLADRQRFPTLMLPLSKCDISFNEAAQD